MFVCESEKEKRNLQYVGNHVPEAKRYRNSNISKWKHRPLQFIIFCQEPDVSEMAAVSLTLPRTVISPLREPPEKRELSIKA